MEAPVLVLSRRPGEAVQIGQDIVVTVLEVRGNKVRLGFVAPDLPVIRCELKARLATAGEVKNRHLRALRTHVTD